MRRSLLLVLALQFAACGGKSQSEQIAPSAGASGSGGSAGNAGTAGSGGGSSVCPPLEPLAGSACQGSACCNYSLDICSTSQICCLGDVWVPSQIVSGASPDCSSFSADNLPQDGSSCLCQGTLDCVYGDCSTGVYTVRCDNVKWTVTNVGCPVDKPCGTSSCASGEACVITENLGGNLYTCHPDPCLQQGKATACECASSLCRSYETCTMRNDDVYCACTTC